MDSKGRPTFSSLKPEAAVQFYDGMHLDRIKQLYGMPSVFKTTTIAKMKCHFAGYAVSEIQYPRNAYNPGTEKFESRVMLFYVELNTYKCLAIKFDIKFLITPYGKSVGMGD